MTLWEYQIGKGRLFRRKPKIPGSAGRKEGRKEGRKKKERKKERKKGRKEGTKAGKNTTV